MTIEKQSLANGRWERAMTVLMYTQTGEEDWTLEDMGGKILLHYKDEHRSITTIPIPRELIIGMDALLDDLMDIVNGVSDDH